MRHQDCLNIFWDKLCIGSKINCSRKILKIYENQGFAIINFAYFAVLVKGQIIDNKCNLFGKNFLNADMILPDGIALKLRAKKKRRFLVDNMNGDDFLRGFFKWLNQEKIEYVVVGYGGKNDAHLIEKTKTEFKNISTKSFYKFFHGYADLPWEELSSLKDYKGVKILLQSRGGPQEQWTVDNLKNIKEMGLLVFNVGGLFDHWAGYEPRAPKFLQKLKLEWLRRLILNPKKNWSKVRDSLIVFKEIL